MQIVIYIYNGFTALDAVGPYEVLSRLPNADLKFVSIKKGVIVSDTHFLKLVADHDISEIDKADILLIPGSTVGFTRELRNKKLLEWIIKIHNTTRWTTTVCTGSIILAATGLLKGIQATTHWGVIPLLADYGAIPSRARYIQHERIITAAGVSAGIDMSLYLVQQLLGTEKAKPFELLIEYDPQPPFKSGNYHTADQLTFELARKMLMRDAEKDLSLIDKIRNIKTLVKVSKASNVKRH
jgi:putative intracellular protease/amidase